MTSGSRQSPDHRLAPLARSPTTHTQITLAQSTSTFSQRGGYGGGVSLQQTLRAPQQLLRLAVSRPLSAKVAKQQREAEEKRLVRRFIPPGSRKVGQRQRRASPAKLSPTDRGRFRWPELWTTLMNGPSVSHGA